MWKNSLKDVESDSNKILYEILLDCFLQQNGTFFLNKPRNMREVRDFVISELRQYLETYEGLPLGVQRVFCVFLLNILMLFLRKVDR